MNQFTHDPLPSGFVPVSAPENVAAPQSVPIPAPAPARAIPAPPEGFEVIQQQEAPALPEGFVMETAEQPAPVPEQGSFIPEVGKSVASGALNTFGTELQGLSSQIQWSHSPKEQKLAESLLGDFGHVKDMDEAEWTEFRMKALKGIRGRSDVEIIAKAQLVRMGKMTPENAVSSIDLKKILPQGKAEEKNPP